MRVDNIPDYLDVDDDGDGYATWEIVEGGAGILSTTNPGIPYVLDSDANSIPNYLDCAHNLSSYGTHCIKKLCKFGRR
jgi:hypothetical protein